MTTAKGYKTKNDPDNRDNHAIDGLIDWQPKLTALTKTEAVGAKAALDAIREAFGKKGEYWIKGDYSRRPEDDEGNSIEGVFDGMCLSGAAAAVNGKYETIARAALSVAIGVDEGAETADDTVITRFNDRETTTWSDVLDIFKQAKKVVAASAKT